MSSSQESQPQSDDAVREFVDFHEPSDVERQRDKLTELFNRDELWSRIQSYLREYHEGKLPADAEVGWRRELDELEAAIAAAGTAEAATAVAEQIRTYRQELADLEAALAYERLLAAGNVTFDGTNWVALSALTQANFDYLSHDRLVPLALQERAQTLFGRLLQHEERPNNGAGLAREVQAFINETQAYPARTDPALTTDEAAIQRGLRLYADHVGLPQAINQAVVRRHGSITNPKAERDIEQLEAMADWIIQETVSQKSVDQQFAVGAKLIDSLIHDYIQGTYARLANEQGDEEESEPDDYVPTRSEAAQQRGAVAFAAEQRLTDVLEALADKSVSAEKITEMRAELSHFLDWIRLYPEATFLADEGKIQHSITGFERMLKDYLGSK